MSTEYTTAQPLYDGMSVEYGRHDMYTKIE